MDKVLLSLVPGLIVIGTAIRIAATGVWSGLGAVFVFFGGVLLGFWAGVKKTTVWMRDQFAALFSTIWLYSILWTVIFGTFCVLLYIDGKFSRHLAEGASVNPLSFQAMGWMYRLFAASFLMAAARCAYKGLKGAATFRILGAFASVIVCLHAIGFGLEALSDRRDTALAKTGVITEQVETNEQKAKRLAKQKDEIRAALTADTQPLRERITQLDNDGKLNEDRTDAIQRRIDEMTDTAQAKIDVIDAKLLELIDDSGDRNVETVQVRAENKAWAPLFYGLAQLFTWTKTPTDWAVYVCAVVFITFWVLLGESLVIFLPERLYVMHMYDRAAALEDEDEQAALRSGSAYKGVDTRRKRRGELPKVRDDEYWTTRIEKAMKTKMVSPTAEGMWNTYFNGLGSVHELRGKLKLRVKRGLMTQEEYDWIMREGPYAPGKPKLRKTGEETGDGYSVTTFEFTE